jgi:hypothetical protein
MTLWKELLDDPATKGEQRQVCEQIMIPETGTTTMICITQKEVNEDNKTIGMKKTIVVCERARTSFCYAVAHH